MDQSDPSQRGWRLIGHTVLGATHQRSGLPNQDALQLHDAAWPLVIAIADGHGSAVSCRSDAGAATAVRLAVSILKDFLQETLPPANLSAIKNAVEDQLPRKLVYEWQQHVDKLLSDKPFLPAELKLVEERGGTVASQALNRNPRLAYGTTLLITAVTESFILYLQLGDGDILTVSATGEVARPLPADARLFANETTSMCGPKAWEDFRVGFSKLEGSPPALILVSTDGYANSFRDEASFLQIGTDLWAMLREHGLDMVNHNLAEWLQESSQSGSGDDITLGIVCGPGAVPSVNVMEVVQPIPPETQPASITLSPAALMPQRQASPYDE